MLNNNNNKPIEIGILEISSQNKAILEFFFESAGKAFYKEVSLNEASAFIIDYDYPGAKENWKNIFKITNKPGIIISTHKVEIASTVWVAKPLTSHALTQAALDISKIISQKVTSPSLAPEITSKHEVTKAEETIKADALKVKVQESIVETANVNSLTTSSNNHPSSFSTPPNKPKPPITATLVTEKKQQSPIVDENHDSEDDNEIDALLKSLLDEATPKTNHVVETRTATEDTVSLNQPLDLSDASSDENIESVLTLAENPELINEAVEDLLELSLDDAQEPEKAPRNITENLKTIKQPTANPVESLAISEASKTNKLSLVETNPKSSSTNLDTNESNLPENLSEPATLKQDSDRKNNVTPLNSSVDSIKRNIVSELADKPQEALQQTDSKSPDEDDEELQSLLDEIRQEAEDDPSKEGFKSSKKRFNTVAEKRWFLTCGDIKKPVADFKKNTFNVDNQMLSTLLHVLKQAKVSNNVMRLKFKGVIIVIDTEFDNIFCDISTMNEEFAQICFESIEKESIKIHSLDKSEVRLYRKKMEISHKKTHSTESFIWTISLLSSRGRLPHDANTNLKVGLKHWPNLTRLEPIPHMMQMAAVFKKHPGTLLEISKSLNVSQNIVFAFYNASSALDLIELDQKKLGSLKSISQTSNKKKNSGIFSRLLKRITK